MSNKTFNTILSIGSFIGIIGLFSFALNYAIQPLRYLNNLEFDLFDEETLEQLKTIE